VSHQFSLFGFIPGKIRMDKQEREGLAKLLRESKVKFVAGDFALSVIKLRKFREGLEDFERRLSNRVEVKNGKRGA
jgi:hypothetical protein